MRLILRALEPYRENVEAVAVESTYNWYWLVDGLMGYIDPKEERAVRDLLRKRAQLVHCPNHASVEHSKSDQPQQRPGKIRPLREDTIDQLCGQDAFRVLAIQSNRAVLKCLDEQILILEKKVLSQAKLKPAFEKLLTVDGIGKILGMTIMYETGAIERFEKVGQCASYARCVGSERFSNGKKKGEGNRKNGNNYLSGAFVEGAHFAVRYNEQIRQFYQRKKAKTNGIIAIKAVAHKLALACYHMLKDQTSFDVTRAFA